MPNSLYTKIDLKKKSIHKDFNYKDCNIKNLELYNNNPILLEIICKIKKKWHCHTIILYGSRSQDSNSINSDYDIIAISNNGKQKRYYGDFKGEHLDILIYPEKMVKNTNLLLRISNGIILCQKGDFGENLINYAKKMFLKGPPKASRLEKKFIVIWIGKMMDRIKQGSIDGNFRKYWLLFDLLEIYFWLRDLWYIGPKKSFQWLRENDFSAYLAFDAALKPDAKLNTLDVLINYIISYRCTMEKNKK